MKVTFDEIKKIINNLIDESMTREQISDWALLRQKAEDREDLEYEPNKEEERIWNAIIYLQGVDLKNIDGGYLHSKQDFIQFRKQMNL
jgi:hypothetical protein